LSKISSVIERVTLLITSSEGSSANQVRLDFERKLTPAPFVAKLEAREVVESVYVDPKVKEYVLDLVEATRDHVDVEHGGSPRASLAFLDAGKARAAIRGRGYVIPDDVKSLVAPVLVHRLVLTTNAELSEVDAEDVVAEIAESVDPPTGIDASSVPDGESEAVSDGGEPAQGE